MRKLIQGFIALCLLSATFAIGQTPHVVNIPDSTPTAIRPFNVHIVVRRADGTVVSDNWGPNLRTTGGADWQANVEAGTSAACSNHLLRAEQQFCRCRSGRLCGWFHNLHAEWRNFDQRPGAGLRYLLAHQRHEHFLGYPYLDGNRHAEQHSRSRMVQRSQFGNDGA